MSQITSSIGLITGIPIQDTVDQLIAVAGQPRDQLAVRTDGVRAERSAIDALSGLVLGLKSSLTTLRLPTTFSTRSATSSSEAVSVAVAGTPAVGSYELTPLATAAAHQFVSNSFVGPDDVGSAGVFSLQFGGQVDRGVALADLNGGEGFTAGKIRITDRSGVTETIDLRGATTIDDVLAAINSAEEIDVTASTDGGAIKLTDNTGESGTFRVREVGSGTTAETLGLANLSAAADTLTGGDVRTIGAATRLSSLNDGLGVRINEDLAGVDDLTITLADETTGGVDLSTATTLGDVVAAINNDEDLTGKVTASIGANGLVVQDLTSGGGSFTISSALGGSVAEGLGLTATASGDTITGDRLVSGLRDTLVSSLNGGAGFALGEIQITTTASGGPVTVDLSGETTLEGVVDTINTTLGATIARVNDARSGILITDTGGGSALEIANGATGATADDLGIATTSAVASVDSGALNRQTVSEATLLSALNGGAGVRLGEFTITDAAGNSYDVDLNTSDSPAETLGDVIDAINGVSTNDTVVASLNATGDGLLLTDTSGGSGTLSVAEVDSGTTAADLRLVGDSTGVNGSGQQVIDGTSRFTIDLADLESDARSFALADLNNGDGVDLGIFEVVAGDGENFAVNLANDGGAQTIGDVLDRINAAATEAGVDVVASVNEAGTGVLLTDNTSGGGELTVNDLGSDTTGADLNLIRTAADDLDTEIDGAGLFSTLDADGRLAELASRINAFGGGVSASLLQDATGFRLAITAETTGAANELLASVGSTPIELTETSRPQDAAALLGGGDFVVTSSTNDFNGVVEGLDVTVNQATATPATLTVTRDNQPTIDAVRGFVDAYNAIVANLDAVTDFDADTLTTGVLFGTTEALRVETELARVVTGRFTTSAGTQTLASVGVTIGSDGRLSLNASELEDALAADPDAVEALFREAETGLAERLDDVTDQLAGDANSLLSSSSSALGRTIDTNEERIELLNERLELQRTRLLNDFIQMEQAIALLQNNLTALQSIPTFAPVTRSSVTGSN